MKLLHYILAPASPMVVEIALLIMRVSLGILTTGHGIPKIIGGPQTWSHLGTFVQPMGIYFLPMMWGLLGACIEFFGGIALTVGLGTRIASLCLMDMMIVAYVWHLNRGDAYNVSSYPLTLVFIFFGFMLIGGGYYSLDAYLSQNS